ncbi:AbrB family transcriptional regulator [Pararhizobium polonicum]|uniref:AbrB family transcriptional regulator n=1 Tax=Pararhizobium polonicum TaxID=1612624 RepID=A0A1C7NZD6_9HYPH|nr:type II toxin-antitoxin system PrlF family antitoxin [Pararhizobium polonicum]OBZ94367.1 AbrB family transcriptional regulator [Pararhizobium polonicum]
MAALLREVSTITVKGQTTVPKSVRQALGIDLGGRIAFYVDDQRHVTVERVDDEEDDPVIDGFLAFLARDMQNHPGRAVGEISASLRERIGMLTTGMEVDTDAPIEGDVAL